MKRSLPGEALTYFFVIAFLELFDEEMEEVVLLH
jgi:hypothetical protein